MDFPKLVTRTTIVAFQIVCLFLSTQSFAGDPAEKTIRMGGPEMAQRLIEKVPPAYPPEAAAKHIEGVVNLDVLIDATGVPSEFKILHGHPLLVGAAVKAVAKGKYEPVTVEGQPAKVRTGVDVNFSLH